MKRKYTLESVVSEDLYQQTWRTESIYSWKKATVIRLRKTTWNSPERDSWHHFRGGQTATKGNQDECDCLLTTRGRVLHKSLRKVVHRKEESVRLIWIIPVIKLSRDGLRLCWTCTDGFKRKWTSDAITMLAGSLLLSSRQLEIIYSVGEFRGRNFISLLSPTIKGRININHRLFSFTLWFYGKWRGKSKLHFEENNF